MAFNPDCNACGDRHDGVFGSYAAPCPLHDDNGKLRPRPEPKPEIVVGSTFYRIEDRRVSCTVDAERELYRTDVEVYLLRYKVQKLTPKGVWLSLGFGTRRFVLTDANKKFACSTVAEAKESFYARKKVQIRILSGRIGLIESSLRKAEYLEVSNA